MVAHVIVVGGGLSGLSAAHTIIERGGSVLLLDKNGFFGGNSTKATSGINGALTRSQIDLDIKDSVKAFYEDTLKSARDLARPDLIKILTHKSSSAIEWLQDVFALDLSKVSRLGGHSFPRTHRGGAQFPGMVITYALMEKLENLAEEIPDRVRFLKKARVTRLLKEGDIVVGVEYEYNGKKVTDKGPVILATGGYAADFSKDGLLNKYRPDVMNLATTNGDHCTGDGHKMVFEIGGMGVDLDKVQVHPTGLIDPKEVDSKVKFLAAEALRGVGGLLLDANGKRFCDELGHRDYVSGMMWKNKFPIRLILNGKGTSEIEWHCKHYVGRGLMKKIEGGEALAKEFGCSPKDLEETFQQYNAIAEGKSKDPWGKKFFHNLPWKLNDTFHVALMQPVLHYTMGGVYIDDASRVCREDKAPIKGLYACGELAGGVHGANRLGGSSLLGCVVYGRVAGDSACNYLFQEILSGKAAERLGQISDHINSRVFIDPQNKKVTVEYLWGEQGSSDGSDSASNQPTGQASAAPVHNNQQSTSNSTGQDPAKVKTTNKKELVVPNKTFTMEQVAKHNQKDDCWVVVEGVVLDVTSFLEDHPGGAKAILLYAGKDATEEFLMLHERNVIPKYAQDTPVGRLAT